MNKPDEDDERRGGRRTQSGGEGVVEEYERRWEGMERLVGERMRAIIDLRSKDKCYLLRRMSGGAMRNMGEQIKTILDIRPAEGRY